MSGTSAFINTYPFLFAWGFLVTVATIWILVRVINTGKTGRVEVGPSAAATKVRQLTVEDRERIAREQAMKDMAGCAVPIDSLTSQYRQDVEAMIVGEAAELDDDTTVIPEHGAAYKLEYLLDHPDYDPIMARFTMADGHYLVVPIDDSLYAKIAEEVR